MSGQLRPDPHNLRISRDYQYVVSKVIIRNGTKRWRLYNTFQTQCWLNWILSTIVYFDIKLNLGVVTGQLYLEDNKTVIYRYAAITTVLIRLQVDLKTWGIISILEIFAVQALFCYFKLSFHEPTLLFSDLSTEAHPKATQLLKLHNECLNTV